MSLQFISLCTVFVATLTSLLTLNHLAPTIGLVDHPNSRKVHADLTPLTGGIAIAIGAGLSLLLVSESLPNSFFWIFLGAFILVCAGAYDDARNLPVTHRFLVQGLCASLVIIGGDIKITTLGEFPMVGQLELGIITYPFTLLAIIAGVNALNLIDGLDGLASSISLVTFSALGIIAFLGNHVGLLQVTGIFSVALVVFLNYNMRFPWQKSAKAFLGDAGSTALGFTLACLLIFSSSPDVALIAPTTALWFLAVPLFDTIGVIIRRIESGQHAFKASKDHIHHILLQQLNSVPITVVVMFSFAISFVGIGLFVEAYGSPLVSLGLFIAFNGAIYSTARTLRKRHLNSSKAPSVNEHLAPQQQFLNKDQAA